jgi:DNA replication and repair protein RecF
LADVFDTSGMPRKTVTSGQTPPRFFWVRRLDLFDFRNYENLSLRLPPPGRPVLLVGANGAGKTNLLEALSFLAPGRGLKHARLGEVARKLRPERSARPERAREWAVAAEIDGPDGCLRIGTGCRLSPAAGTDAVEAERRAVRINGAERTGTAALAEMLDVLWLTPEMDRIYLDGPSGRRRFLDRLVINADPGHGRRLGAFAKAMRERNRLLQDGTAEEAWLGALEQEMAEHASAIAAARLALVSRLGQILLDADGPFPKARLAVRGLMEDRLEVMPALAAEELYRTELAANRERDRLLAATEIGPHRSDLEIGNAETGEMALEASTGEQKALLIAIILAHARFLKTRRGVAPLLLLDEALAHLDHARREALLASILDLGAQAWLSGTDRGLFAGLEGRAEFLAVRPGVAPLVAAA